MSKDGAGNLLALAVLSLLRERPMHPYEISSIMRERGLSYSIKLNFGSLYSVIEGLLGQGLLLVRGKEREGRHPERTIYAITEAGEAELLERLRGLIGSPMREYPSFVAGLAFLAHLGPSEALALLEERGQALAARIEAEGKSRAASSARGVDGLFLIEMVYSLAMLAAELAWVKELAGRIAEGDLAKEKNGALGWSAPQLETGGTVKV
jgi:DNA-binding PadR family transcriptional regulator